MLYIYFPFIPLIVSFEMILNLNVIRLTTFPIMINDFKNIAFKKILQNMRLLF